MYTALVLLTLAVVAALASDDPRAAQARRDRGAVVSAGLAFAAVLALALAAASVAA